MTTGTVGRMSIIMRYASTDGPGGISVDETVEGYLYRAGHLDEVVTGAVDYEFSADHSSGSIVMSVNTVSETMRFGFFFDPGRPVSVPGRMKLSGEVDSLTEGDHMPGCVCYSFSGGPLDAVSPILKLSGYGSIHVEQMDHRWYWVGLDPVHRPGPASRCGVHRVDPAPGLMLSIYAPPRTLAVMTQTQA